MKIVAVGIAAIMAVTRADAIYGGVLVWAFVGIAIKHADKPQVLFSAAFAAAARPNSSNAESDGCTRTRSSLTGR